MDQVQQEVKLCKDCKHLKDIKCQRPDGVSLVTGLSQLRNTMAASERSYDAIGCGRAAKYFSLKVEA